MCAKASRLCSWIAVGLFVFAVVSFVFHESGAPAEQALVIEESERDLGAQQFGTPIVKIRVRNGSRAAQKIMGMDQG